MELVNARVQAVVPTARPELPLEEGRPYRPRPLTRSDVWFEERPRSSAIFDRERLRPGAAFAGPAVIAQMDATTVVPPGWSALVDGRRNLVLSPVEEG